MVLYTDNRGTDRVLDLVSHLLDGGQPIDVRPVGQLPRPTRREKLLTLRGTYHNCLQEVEHQLEVALREPQRFAAELAELRAHRTEDENLIADCTRQLAQEGGEPL